MLMLMVRLLSWGFGGLFMVVNGGRKLKLDRERWRRVECFSGVVSCYTRG
ncbi:hypothetical protein Hanom_Chr16g01475461 [Helianthus anomalus]